MNNSYIEKCPITNSEKYVSYLDLGMMPLVNNLLNTKYESLNCEKYPLKVNYFEDSGLSMLSYSVDKDNMFKNYTYKSGISLPYIEHCKEMFSFVQKFIDIKEDDTVLDIGGNDGTLLRSFKSIKPSMKVLNVDLSENIVKEAIKNGIPSVVDFWGVNFAQKINKKFKLITSTNVFQHTLDINDFAGGISQALDSEGIWCLEFPYWKNSLETNQYDQIYHEHMYYYLVKPLSTLFNKHGLKIISIAERSIHGGSLRLIVSLKDSKFSVSKEVESYIHSEDLDAEYYVNWGKNIQQHISNCRNFILDLKKQGASVSCFGAAAKGCIVLNSVGLDDSIIDYVVDDTDLKQNKFIPGTGIKVVSREYMKNNPTDYLIILAHNFSDYIIKSLPAYKGKFIILMPTIKIL